MTYSGIVKVAADTDLRARVCACAAEQGISDPESWALGNRWAYSSAPTWAAKYEYALATETPNPGTDTSVISDGDILSTVQDILGL